MKLCWETNLRPERRPRDSPCRGWANRRTSGTSGPRCVSLDGSWVCRSWGRAERRAVASSQWDQSPWPAQTPAGRTTPSQDRPTLQKHDKLVSDTTELKSNQLQNYCWFFFSKLYFPNPRIKTTLASRVVSWAKDFKHLEKCIHDCDWNNIGLPPTDLLSGRTVGLILDVELPETTRWTCAWGEGDVRSGQLNKWQLVTWRQWRGERVKAGQLRELNSLLWTFGDSKGS